MPAQEAADFARRLPFPLPDGPFLNLLEEDKALLFPHSPEEDLGDLFPGDPAFQGSPDFGPLLGGEGQDDLRAQSGDEGVQVLVGEGVVYDDQEAAVGV